MIFDIFFSLLWNTMVLPSQKSKVETMCCIYCTCLLSELIIKAWFWWQHCMNLTSKPQVLTVWAALSADTHPLYKCKQTEMLLIFLIVQSYFSWNSQKDLIQLLKDSFANGVVLFVFWNILTQRLPGTGESML